MKRQIAISSSRPRAEQLLGQGHAECNGFKLTELVSRENYVNLHKNRFTRR